MKQVRVLITGTFFIIASVLFFGNFQTVSAEEYYWKFKVPVEVKNIPDTFNKISLGVRIWEGTKGMLGGADTTVKLNASGNFSGMITVYVYPKNMLGSAIKASRYTVKLYLQKNGPLVNPDPWAEENAQPGTAVVTEVEGPLEAPPLAVYAGGDYKTPQVGN